MRIRVLHHVIRTASITSLLAMYLAGNPVAAQAPADPLDARVAGRLEQVSRMLDAASRTDANSLLDAKTEIEELPYPARGDRRLARRLNSTALEKFKAEQMAPALADFEKAWQTDPSDQEITNNYGYALYRNNRLAEAESKLRYTLALAPARATAWANLAEVFGAQGQAKRAADAFVVSHRFSRNPDITRQYIEKFANSSDLPGLKDGAGLALQKLFPAANATSGGSQALAVTNSERKAVDAIELAAQKAAKPTEPPQAAADGNKAPAAVADPYARMLQDLPNPDVQGLYQAAAKGSTEARETLLRMANAGNARAQNAVGNLYNNGQGVETNHELANTWYRKSAMAGFVLAQFYLAWNQHHGIGMPVDYALALDNYRRAAEQGHPSAMNNAGVMLERGMGTPMDRKAAFNWHMRAAETGLARGAYNVGQYLEWGFAGTSDRKRALTYYLSAGNIGFPQAQLKVAQAYEYGWDGSPDKGMAIDWYKRAALQGLEPARDALKRLGVAEY
jgi:hypothetical protein